MTDPRFAEALLTEVRRLGEARGLDPLDWRLMAVEENPVLAGAPLHASGAAACAAWARSFEMKEYSFDVDGSRSWFLVGDRWTLEVSTLPHGDAAYGS